MKTQKRVYLACGGTDMRKSINGLSALVQDSFKLSPFDEAMFVFCNKSRDRIKILVWEDNGFWLYLKRLERGHFKWPSESDTPMQLDYYDLENLLRAPGLEQKLKRKKTGSAKLY